MSTNNSLNAPFPLSATLGGLGVASPTAHGVLIGEGASAVTPIVLGAGQVLIGTTASDPAAATITGSAGITVSATTGAINIAGSGTGITWNSAASATQAMVANNGYYVNDGATPVAFTLPSTAAAGTILAIGGFAAGGWTLAQNALQNIQFGSVVTTTGVGGSMASTNKGDSLFLVCTVANTSWIVVNSIGNITYV